MPGLLARTFQSLWLGRTYVDVVSEVDDRVREVEPEKRYGFMDYTKITCASGRTYSVHAAPDTLLHYVGSDGFGLYSGRAYKAGESIVHGYVNTGDQVFVDKFTYNFRLPHRGDVFVFDTANIPTERRAEMDEHVRSEYYIKRLAGTPGDVLRIDPPRLFINGQLAREPGFVRVMSARNGYRGYSGRLGPTFPIFDGPVGHLHRAARELFRVGGQQLQQFGQPRLGAGAGRERRRPGAVRLLAVHAALGLHPLKRGGRKKLVGRPVPPL